MNTLYSAAAGAVVFGALTLFAAAHEYTAGEITIDHPMAFETAPSVRAGGGFMTLVNEGEESDRLIEVRADFPKVELHTTVEEDGVAKMIHVDGIDLPSGETVELKPGGYHVMFMGLGDDPFEEGEEIPATLVFEKAGETEIVFTVEARGAIGDMGHSGHGEDMSEDQDTH